MEANRFNFKAVDLQGNIIEKIGSIEFFEDGTIIVNNEIPIKKLLQSTGLFDKKGVEIYEGDIIRHNQTVVEVKPIIPLSRLHSYYEVPTEDDWFSWSNTDWEVIGNIYEHPHLLGENK